MKDLVDYIAAETRFENKVLVEKDIILHNILLDLSTDSYFEERFAFKGGTCLIKCYYGYYRFSEDLDFTWREQGVFSGKSQKEIRRFLSKVLNKLLNLFESIAHHNSLIFQADKANPEYVELGGSNKFATFKLWYTSAAMSAKQFIKIQINFFELFKFPFEQRKAHSIVQNIKPEELGFLFPEQAQKLLTIPQVWCYDVKEILLEKVRAILTRRGLKARDFIDAFLILKKEHLTMDDFRADIVEKIRFMLQYEKYVQNLKGFTLEKYVLGEEEKLLLHPLEEGFPEFLRAFQVFLTGLYNELK